MRKRQLKKNLKTLHRLVCPDYHADINGILSRGRQPGYPKTVIFYIGNTPITVSIDEKKTAKEKPDEGNQPSDAGVEKGRLSEGDTDLA